MTNTCPVRLAPHINPGFFTPHFAVLTTYCVLSAVGLYLHVPGILLWLAWLFLLLAMSSRHRIFVTDTTIRIRHWLWTWRINRDDITEVSWDERERYLTVGHARGSSLLALRSPVRAISLRRRAGPAILLFGKQGQLDQIEESLSGPISSASTKLDKQT